MHGTMMDFPLVLPVFLERCGKLFRDVEIVSRRPDNTLTRTNYGAFYDRARRLAEALTKLGLHKGDRVATMMWNHAGHLEAFFGVPCAGGILHALNLRLHPHEIAGIVKHAGDRFLILDDVLLPLYEKFCKGVKFDEVIVVPYGGCASLHGFLNYEELLAETSANFVYPEINENDGAAMCFTSGTTGYSKGVIYTHRSLVLHSMAEAMVDAFGISHNDTLLPLAPMFHANAWGVPYTAVMTGAKLVLLGPNVDPEGILDLMLKEQVTIASAVPTVWIGVLDALEKNPGRWKFERQVRVISGGTAPPLELMRKLDAFGLRILHLWGLTETSPLATTGHLKSSMREWPEEEKYQVRAKQGWPVPLLEMRIMRPEGEAPWDGETGEERRRMDQLRRSGKYADGSSGGEGSLRGGRAASAMAGAAARGDCPERWRCGRRRGIARFPGKEFCEMAAAGCICHGQRDSAHQRRKIQENCPARTICKLEMGCLKSWLETIRINGSSGGRSFSSDIYSQKNQALQVAEKCRSLSSRTRVSCG